jgi:hypothetical protein
MFILYKILTSSLLKIVYLIFFISITIYWAQNGLYWCQRQSIDNANETITEVTETLRRQNPEAAAELDKMRHLHNVNAFAATLQERKHLDGIDGLVRLAQEKKNSRATFDLYLTEMALNQTLITNADQRQNFLNAHANHLQHLDWIQKDVKDQNTQYFLNQHTSAYLQQLEKASQNPDEWQRVRDNPIMVQLMVSGVDADDLEFYDREKEWLDDVLYLLLTSIETNPDIDSININRNINQSEYQNSALSINKLNSDNLAHDQWTRHIIQTIRKNHPYFHDTIKEYLQDSQIDMNTGLIFIFNIFDRYGKTIQICIDKGMIPLEELLEMIFVNSEYCEKYSHSPEHFASKLINIRREMPNVWKHAGRPFVLQLAEDVSPQIADALCRQFGTDDIAAFLYTKYDDAIQNAATAINKFGDVAIYILNRYSDSELFRKYMKESWHDKDSSIGVRLIPYIAKFEDKGLERLEANLGWLDKYFDKEGNPKQDKWYEILPVGAAFKVAENMANGHPSEWSELGWAAVDAVTIASFGAAATIKTAGAATVKSGTKTIARNNILKSGTRTTSRGARNLAKTQKSFLFRQGIRAIAKQPHHLIPQGGRLIVQTGKNIAITPLKRLTSNIYRSARFVHTSWQGVNPVTRKMIYRSICATGIAITLCYRTIPGLQNMLPHMLPQIGEQVGALVANSARVGAETVASLLNGFLEQLLKLPNGSRFQPYVVYWATLLIMIVATISLFYRLFLQKKRRIC